MAASSCDDSAVAWLAAYQAALVGFVLPIVNGDRQAAEDVVQETMLRGWQHAAELSPRIQDRSCIRSPATSPSRPTIAGVAPAPAVVLAGEPRESPRSTIVLAGSLRSPDGPLCRRGPGRDGGRGGHHRPGHRGHRLAGVVLAGA
ncbi:MAG TPA: sigma factor [Streptosporangiaceae bacterium]